MPEALLHVAIIILYLDAFSIRSTFRKTDAFVKHLLLSVTHSGGHTKLVKLGLTDYKAFYTIITQLKSYYFGFLQSIGQISWQSDNVIYLS